MSKPQSTVITAPREASHENYDPPDEAARGHASRDARSNGCGRRREIDGGGECVRRIRNPGRRLWRRAVAQTTVGLARNAERTLWRGFHYMEHGEAAQVARPCSGASTESHHAVIRRSSSLRRA